MILIGTGGIVEDVGISVSPVTSSLRLPRASPVDEAPWRMKGKNFPIDDGTYSKHYHTDYFGDYLCPKEKSP